MRQKLYYEISLIIAANSEATRLEIQALTVKFREDLAKLDA